ncbi:MAG: hypothetical protein ACTSU6_05250 [Candidatus Njordarchaeales archaeon]
MKKISVRCPLCHQQLFLNIDERKLRLAPGGIISIPIIHGNKPHILLVYLDRNGLIRGQEVFNTLIDMSYRVPFKDIIKIVGEKVLAKILAAGVTYSPIYVRLNEKVSKILQAFLSGIFQGEILLTVDKDSAEYTIDMISKHYDTIIGEKYFLKIIKDCLKLESDKSKILKIASEIENLRRKANDAIAYLSKRKMLVAELEVQLGLSEEEFNIIRKIIKNKRPDLAKRIIDGFLDLIY